MRLFQPTYTKKITIPGGNTFRETRVSDVWWVDFTVNGTKRRESTGLRDKNAAMTRAGQIVREFELRAAGIETHGDTTRATLACLLDEYRAEMTRRGLAPKHVETTLARCKALTQGVPNMAALTPTAVRLGLERLRGASAKTVNGYRTALFGFCGWLVREGRWTGNPVEAVSPARVVADGPARRALTGEEQRALLDLDSKWHNAYVIALNTGLRRGEIDALKPEDVLLAHSRFDDGLPRYQIRVRARGAKNRKEAILPLPRGVSLPKALPLKAPTMRAFRRDLKAAGITDPAVDFHSLRVTFATNLARAGVPLTLAQRLMRHSDPALTSNIYTQLRLDDEEAAVDRAVPDLIKSGDRVVYLGDYVDAAPVALAAGAALQNHEVREPRG